MFRRIASAVALLTALVSVPALAADLSMPTPTEKTVFTPVPAVNWTGFYAGVFVGAHLGTVQEYVCSGGCAGNFALNGVEGGVQAGYDYQFSRNWVVGGFVQLPLLKPTGSATIAGPTTFTVDPKFGIVGGVRVGYVMGKFLPYGLVGIAAENDTVSDPGNAPNATHVGFVAGVGAEYRLAQHWSLDARYTYMSLGAATYDWGGGPEKYGENSHNFTIAANYRF